MVSTPEGRPPLLKTQVKLLTAIATAAAIGTSLIAVSPAQARYCNESIAIGEMNSLIAGGASLKQAYNYSVSKGNLDGTEMCWIKLKGYTKGFELMYPAIYRAIWTRTRPSNTSYVGCNEKVDAVFYRRYPKLEGTKLTSMNGFFAREWMSIQDSLC